MKILVGILFSNEPQFNNCIDSIKNQIYPFHFEYFIISGLPKINAHDELYKQFTSNCHNFDIFIKLDADMVIKRNDFFDYVYHLFLNNKNVDWIRILVYDYFLQSNISGLNIYSNNVKWIKNHDNFFTDRTLDMSSVKKHIGIDPKINWISHCENPTMYQAFNFGLHRSIKIFQYSKENKVNFNIHWTTLRKIFFNYLNNINNKQQNLIILATIVYVYENKLSSESINNNSKTKSYAYDYLCNKNSSELWDYFKNSQFYFLFKIPFFSYHLFYLIRNTFISK